MIDMCAVLQALGDRRPVFHSEADFQHALAWQLHLCYSNCNIRLERPFPIHEEAIHVDIWCDTPACSLAIELKYVTRELNVVIHGERFALKNQAAEDVRRYDFLRDIQRLESIAESSHSVCGYAIILTNNHLFWQKPTQGNVNDAEFRIHERRLNSGTHDWGPNTGDGTKKDREDPIEIHDTYDLTWQDYADVHDDGGSPSALFRYLLVRAEPGNH